MPHCESSQTSEADAVCDSARLNASASKKTPGDINAIEEAGSKIHKRGFMRNVDPRIEDCQCVFPGTVPN